MRLNGKITKVDGYKITVLLGDEPSLYELYKLANESDPSVEIDVADKRHISPDQRKKIYALCREIAEWGGYTDEAAKQLMKSYTMEIFNLPEYSLSNCSVTVANEMIYTTLEFCFKNDVPFATRIWDSIPSDYAKQWYCLRYRRCVICGKLADLAHMETVGMGRNRYKIDESQYHYMALCREHHTEQHTIGLTEFIQRYHIKPIKLTNEELNNIAPYYKNNGKEA